MHSIEVGAFSHTHLHCIDANDKNSLKPSLQIKTVLSAHLAKAPSSFILPSFSRQAGCGQVGYMGGRGLPQTLPHSTLQKSFLCSNFYSVWTQASICLVSTFDQTCYSQSYLGSHSCFVLSSNSKGILSML